MDLSGYSLTITCGNSRSAEEKSPVNQRVPPIWGEMVVCFSFRRMGIRELIYLGGEAVENGRYIFWR